MNKKGAFSIIESSVVLLIVTIVLLGIMKMSGLVDNSRIETARAATKSSPVSSFKSLVFWLETTSEKSFIESEVFDGGLISKWSDINPVTNSNKSAISSGSHRPTYIKKCRKNLPCLRFDGDDYFDTEDLAIDSAFINYFIVLKLSKFPTSDAASLISTSGEYSALNDSLKFEIAGGGNNGKARFISAGGLQDVLSSEALKLDEYYMISVFDNGEEVNFFANGKPFGGPFSSSNINKKLKILNIGSFDDGISRDNFFSGDVAEIIIFNEPLRSIERQQIEQYLSQKWHFAY